MSNQKKIQDKIDKLNKLRESFDAADSKEVGDKVVKSIQKRSRQGKDVEGQNFDALSKEYKKQRKRNSRNLDETTTPNKSNVTATGQMLKSMRAEGVKGKIVINPPSGNRSKELSGSSPRISNREVARYVQEDGRRFFGLTDKQKTELTRDVKNVLLRKLKKTL
jgi:hypothetical protein